MLLPAYRFGSGLVLLLGFETEAFLVGQREYVSLLVRKFMVLGESFELDAAVASHDVSVEHAGD